MTFDTYLALFETLLTSKQPAAPYDNPDYFHYVELNHKRQERWLKKGELLPQTQAVLEQISAPQHWVLITEPWCGDAAHSVPFIEKMAQQNSHIELSIQLRDSASEIENYLTNGGKSIPILIVRNAKNEDLFVWGPRPDAAQKIHLENLRSEKSEDEKKVELQQWYNHDKGKSIQEEITALLRAKL